MYCEYCSPHAFPITNVLPSMTDRVHALWTRRLAPISTAPYRPHAYLQVRFGAGTRGASRENRRGIPYTRRTSNVYILHTARVYRRRFSSFSPPSIQSQDAGLSPRSAGIYTCVCVSSIPRSFAVYC